ncbi:GLPGLI family protein [Pedobacter gandavensis]|uniref:GLPGLI family protein n=1 Tax=Pedobacter gandavensis TaxID=2679963 RepID=UPI00292D6629|nr:GLPGLI family protein [Pedobacter gandavensis]
MKRYYKLGLGAIVFCLLCGFTDSISNTQLPPVSIAYYRFSHIRDSTQSGNVWTEQFLLAFDANRSVYLSETKHTQDSVNRAILKAAEESESDEIDMGTFVPTTPERIYADQQKRAVIKNFNGNNYLITTDEGKIDWKISKETKEILGYVCQEATGLWKGRVYTAWFTTDIPAGFGPWKLNGLPGLILEAHDQSGRISFTCTGLSLAGKLPSEISINLPEGLTRTTAAQYERMEKAYGENLDMDAFDPASVTLMMNNAQSASDSKKAFKVNFPLELDK